MESEISTQNSSNNQQQIHLATSPSIIMEPEVPTPSPSPPLEGLKRKEINEFEDLEDESNVAQEPQRMEISDVNDLEAESNANKEQTMICYHEGDISCLSGSLIGIKRKTFQDIYDLYGKHALEVGFSVRKGNTRYNRAGTVTTWSLLCSCEGIRKEKIEERKRKMFNITRTNCKASLRAKLNADSFVEVVEHILEHNHELSRRELSYMHRSQRKITVDKAVAIQDMLDSGMGATDSFRLMAYEAGGEHAIGHTLKDHRNFVNKLKIEVIESGDAQTLIDILDEQGNKDKEFFFRVQLDHTGRLSNIFWRDSMMKEDYMIYSDVVIFDTTYRTNKYNLICAPFVGINSHWKNVMFGCAFISNEQTGSFEWLFETFKKSMEGVCPVTVFTDQDKAISNAIEKVFPMARHRLCTWHLYLNAQTHLGKLKSDKSFMDAFQKCLSGCTDANEFENCWKSMISDFGVQEHEWLQMLYQLREKWCNAYNKDFFSAGILSSQRSESTNSALGFKAKKTTSLTDFYAIFQATTDRWRSSEANDEFQCSKVRPKSILPMVGILKHASDVYTLALFRNFEKEFLKSLSSSVSAAPCEELDRIVYNVTEADWVYRVTFTVMGSLISCTCKRFEECGILCSHCLRILFLHSIDRIPDRYILKRWTKIAKQSVWDKCSEQSVNHTPWRHQMARKSYGLIINAQETEEGRKIVEDALNNVTLALGALMSIRKETNEAEENEGSSVSVSSITVKNPQHSITKGRKQKRLKTYLQKSKRKKTTEASNAIQSKEFGTKTPNQRLF